MENHSLDERRCRICGTPFLPHPTNVRRQITCGPECRRENRRRIKNAEHRDHIRMEGDLVTCECGQAFPREYDRLGRGTSRRLCPTCRAVDSRTREMLGRLNLPADAPHCADCGCLTDPRLGGAEPGRDNLCLPCTVWREKAARSAQMRALQAILGASKPEVVSGEVGGQDSAKLPLWTFGPYHADEPPARDWRQPWPRSSR